MGLLRVPYWAGEGKECGAHPRGGKGTEWARGTGIFSRCIKRSKQGQHPIEGWVRLFGVAEGSITRADDGREVRCPPSGAGE